MSTNNVHDLLRKILEGAVPRTEPREAIVEAIKSDSRLRAVAVLGAAIDRELTGLNIARSFCVTVTNALLDGAEVPVIEERTAGIRKGMALAARRFAAWCEDDAEALKAAQAACTAHGDAMLALNDKVREALAE